MMPTAPITTPPITSTAAITRPAAATTSVKRPPTPRHVATIPAATCDTRRQQQRQPQPQRHQVSRVQRQQWLLHLPQCIAATCSSTIMHCCSTRTRNCCPAIWSAACAPRWCWPPFLWQEQSSTSTTRALGWRCWSSAPFRPSFGRLLDQPVPHSERPLLEFQWLEWPSSGLP